MEGTLKMKMTPTENEVEWVCPKCDSTNIRFTQVTAYWNASEQWWELDEVDNTVGVCEGCGSHIRPAAVGYSSEKEDWEYEQVTGDASLARAIVNGTINLKEDESNA